MPYYMLEIIGAILISVLMAAGALLVVMVVWGLIIVISLARGHFLKKKHDTSKAPRENG